MKILLISPPIIIESINAPLLGLPLLSSMLIEQGHDVTIYDFNIDFVNFIFSNDYLEYIEKEIFFLTQELNKYSKYPPTKENINSKKDLVNNIKKFKVMYNDMYKILQTFPNIKKHLYSIFENDIKNYITFYHVFQQTIFNISKYLQNPLKIFNKEYYLFENYNKRIINKINKQYDLIGFSILCHEQFNYACLFSQKLKKISKIIYGGAFITAHKTSVDIKKVLNQSADILMYGYGEIPLKMLTDNEPIETIPNVIYLDKHNNVIYNREEHSTKFKFYKPNYNGIDLKEYFSPQALLPIEMSRGCYYGKCEFCNYTDCTPFKIKNIDDLIDEIKEYTLKYNVHNFYFADYGLHPYYAEELSRKIIENKLKINYSTFLRLEKDFSFELLKLMYDSGLRIAEWGVESGSDRILKLINKGTRVENNSKILQTANQIGILNFVYVIIKFPKETIKDLMETKNFLIENDNAIIYTIIFDLDLHKNAPIYQHMDKFGLKESDFNSTAYEYLPNEIRLYGENMRKDLEIYFNKRLSKLSNIQIQTAALFNLM